MLQARNLSSAMSAASSACDHIRDWVLGTPKDTWVSMGVPSDGSYGTPKVILSTAELVVLSVMWVLHTLVCIILLQHAAFFLAGIGQPAVDIVQLVVWPASACLVPGASK